MSDLKTEVKRIVIEERKSIVEAATALGITAEQVNQLYDQLAAESSANIKKRNDMVEHFAYNGDKWDALPDKKYLADQFGLTVPQMEAMISAKRDEVAPKVVDASDLAIDDMPLAVLPDSRLGKWCKERMIDQGRFCVTYAWLAMLASASTFIMPNGESPTNLFNALVGTPNSGKTQAQLKSNYLLGLDTRGLANIQSFGSAEGMLAEISDKNGQPFLWCPDEMGHLMVKAGIQGSSFFTILNILFYASRYNTTVGGRKPVKFNARLTISSGLVTSRFEECFNAETEAGLYDRFLFGLQPTGFEWQYRRNKQFGDPLVAPPAQPFDGGVAAPLEQSVMIRPPEIHDDVYEAQEYIHKHEGINNRVLELAIRCATIDSAWNGAEELRASGLEPFWNLARYQHNVRKVLQTGGGKTYDAQCGNAIMRYLNRKPCEWVSRSALQRGTHVIETYGANTVKFTFSGLVAARMIEVKDEPAKGGRGGQPKVIVRSLAP